MSEYMHNLLNINRPRLDAVFDELARGKIIYIIAGAGFGKTQAAHFYLEKQPMAVVRWVQSVEGENSPPYFWQRLLLSVVPDNAELAAKLTALGFPKSLALFKQFADILRVYEHKALKIFLVFDDFHLIKDKKILLFAERMAHLKLPNLCVIFISRQEPEINTVSLFAKGKAGIITEDDLRFTEDEICNFLSLQNIPYKQSDAKAFLQATAGWAMGVRFLSLALKRFPDKHGYAINIMKTNVFKLFEMEAFENFPDSIKKILVKLSLASIMPLAPLHGITNVAAFLESNRELASFVWFDSLCGDFRVHPLYLSFLCQKQDILSNEEKLDAYSQAAEWCLSNGYAMDAMRYFAKSGQYGRMLELFFSNPHKMPHDTCVFYLEIINEMEEPCTEDANYLLIKSYFYPLMLMGIGNHSDAIRHTQAAISKWENEKTRLAYIILYLAYGNMAYIDMFTCTITHKYEAPSYIKKSMEYLKLADLPPNERADSFNVPDIRSYACLVGENAALHEFDEFYAAAKETVSLISETSHYMYIGYDDLVACELHYYKNDLISAKKYAHSAIKKAREKNQASIETLTKKYLLRIAIHSGDAALAQDIIAQLKNSDSPDFWNKTLLCDLILGSFYAVVGLPKLSPAWFIMSKKEAKNEIHIPVAELAVTLLNYVADKKYDRILTVLYNSYPRSPCDRFLFSELHFLLIASIAKINTGDTDGCVEDFTKAYNLSFNGVFEMFFVELGKHIQPVISAVIKAKNTGIDNKWLEKILRKASAFAKKTIGIANSIAGEKNTKNAVTLSERETEILNDLYQGLSREEIADNRFLSINTVKKILQSIFIKLDAKSSVDAIRIAIKKKLIE